MDPSLSVCFEPQNIEPRDRSYNGSLPYRSLDMRTERVEVCRLTTPDKHSLHVSSHLNLLAP